MTRQESNRLKRILQYHKGYLDALLLCQSQEMDDDTIEIHVDDVKDKIDSLESRLKNSKHKDIDE